MSSPLRIAFAGTPEFAATALAALLQAGHQVVVVYTQPDRPAGRGHKLMPSPVKSLAFDRNLPIAQPRNFKTQESLEKLREWQPDIMIVAAYGIILPQSALDIPRLGCLNIHASLLPRWRGAAPIQRAIQAGDSETGITIMQMEAGLDTGPMLLKRAIPIQENESAGSLHDRLAVLGGQAIVEALAELTSLVPEIQDESRACYAKKLGKQEGAIDWRLSAQEIHRTLRAFTPWPGTYSFNQGEQVKILQAQVVAGGSQPAPGTIEKRDSNGILVACGTDSLLITKLQLPGAKPLAVMDFVNGNQGRLPVGQRFDLPL